MSRRNSTNQVWRYVTQIVLVALFFAIAGLTELIRYLGGSETFVDVTAAVAFVTALAAIWSIIQAFRGKKFSELK